MTTYDQRNIGNYGVIYSLKSPSGKYYIGQSWNIKRRFRKYQYLDSEVKKQPKLYNALKNYGIENFIFEIIEQITIIGSYINNKVLFF